MTTKSLALGLTSLFLGSIALAGNLNLELRFDSDSGTYNGQAQANGTGTLSSTNASHNTKMYVQTGRLDYKGKFTDDVSFRTRIRFNQDESGTQTRDSLGSFVDYAYITHQMCENVDLTVGKMNTDMAGYEGMTSGADLYIKSQGYIMSAIYASGIRLRGTYGNHEISLLGLDDLKKDSTSTGTPARYDSERLTYGLVYKGSFLQDKALGATFSYYVQSPGSTAGVSVSNGLNGTTTVFGSGSPTQRNTFINVGLKYSLGNWYLQGDYDNDAFLDNSSIGQTDTLNTAILSTGYKFAEKHVGRLIYENSTTNAMGNNVAGSIKDGTLNTQAEGVVYEFQPYGNETFRYHVAYTQTDTNAAGGAYTNQNTRSESHVIAGVKILGDFLK